MKRENDRGFTLIEVVVVIAIIGVVSAIAIPSMIGWRGARSLEGAVMNFQSDLQLARLKAIREAEDVSVTIDVASNSYRIFVDYDKDYSFDPGDGDSEIKSITMPKGISISSTTFASDRTRFNSRGRPNVLGTAKLTNTSGSQSSVTVNKLGRIRVERS